MLRKHGFRSRSMQCFHTSFWRKRCVREKLKDLSQDNFDSGPHRMTHNLKIALVFSNQQALQGFWAEVEKDLCQFYADEQRKGLQVPGSQHLIAVGPFIQIHLNYTVRLCGFSL